jgi:hypothetical protein
LLNNPCMIEYQNIAFERNNSDVTTTAANNRYNVDGDDYGSAQGERNVNSVVEISGSMEINEHP